MPKQVSRRGARFVAGWEGFSPTPYRDSAGVWTIGYGFTRLDGKPVGPNTAPISRRRGRKILRRKLNEQYLPAVLDLPPKLWQREVDALTSFAYNLGPGVLTNTSTSTIARRLRGPEGRTRKGRKRIYREELQKWVIAGGVRTEGLVRRRRAEKRLAIYANYASRP